MIIVLLQIKFMLDFNSATLAYSIKMTLSNIQLDDQLPFTRQPTILSTSGFFSGRRRAENDVFLMFHDNNYVNGIYKIKILM